MEKNTTKVQKNYLSVLRKLPTWFISAVIILPVVALISIALNIISTGQINLLFWIILPSILFESSFYAFSNSQLANLIFVLMFWSFLGAILGWITGKIRDKSITT